MTGPNFSAQWLTKIFCCIVLLGLLLSPLSCAPSNTLSPATFEEGDCPIYVRSSLDMKCGVLIVPENRESENGKTIQIRVAVIKSQNPAPALDPVVYLPGGPGSSGFDEVLHNLSAFNEIRAERDLIVVDLRGTGYSKPALACPEYEKAFFDTVDDLPYLKTQEELNQAFLKCQTRLQQAQIDIGAYNNLASAQDIENLRLALGYDRWNLLGVSYGTRTALTILREYPQGVRSAILDSTIPPQVEPFAGWVFSLERSFKTLFTNCAADDSCRQAYPNLEADFYRLVEQLDAQPVTVRSYAYSGSGYDVAVDGDTLINLVFLMYYYTSEISKIPNLIEKTLAGDKVELGRALLYYLMTPYFTDYGAYYSVICTDEAAFTNYAEVQKEAASAQPRLGRVGLNNSRLALDLCENWKHNKPPMAENRPVKSAVPTLILAGEYDPVTPPDWGRQTAATLKNAHFYLFTGLTHGVFYSNEESNGCVSRLVTSFLEQPTSDLQDGCVAELPALKFDQ